MCCKRIFDRIKGNLAEIQPKNHQNVQKMHFLHKVPGVNGLTTQPTNMISTSIEKVIVNLFQVRIERVTRFLTFHVTYLMILFLTGTNEIGKEILTAYPLQNARERFKIASASVCHTLGSAFLATSDERFS